MLCCGSVQRLNQEEEVHSFTPTRTGLCEYVGTRPVSGGSFAMTRKTHLSLAKNLLRVSQL